MRQWTKTWTKTMPGYRLVSLTETADDVVEVWEATTQDVLTENDPPATLKRPAAQKRTLKRPAAAMKTAAKAAKAPMKAAKAKTKKAAQ